MASALPGGNFNSSRLVRALAELSRPDIPEAKRPFAERLGQWLDLTDAMSLFSALGTTGAPSSTGESVAITELRAEVERLRGSLAESVRNDGVFNSCGKVRVKLPIPAPNVSPDTAADFSPYHRYYLAHQRDMAAGIGPLRSKLRNALARHSLKLKQLATVDAVLDQSFANRERTLLATVPLLLAKRFTQLQPADLPAVDQWLQPGGWLAIFCKDMQGVLLAELELRLQPVLGLLETLGNEVNN